MEIEGDIYCEGALVDTVNFKDLLKDHPELDEIRISRIVDADQVRAPNKLHHLLANLCELFAATVGEDDIKLFKYHVMCGEIGEEDSESRDRWKGTLSKSRSIAISILNGRTPILNEDERMARLRRSKLTSCTKAKRKIQTSR